MRRNEDLAGELEFQFIKSKQRLLKKKLKKYIFFIFKKLSIFSHLCIWAGRVVNGDGIKKKNHCKDSLETSYFDCYQSLH